VIWGRKSLATYALANTKHDATEIQEVPPAVQIIDPTHPLFGRTYPIANMMTPHGWNWISVEMPCGSKRVIPREATSLDQDTLAVERLLKLTRISVSLMLHLQQLLDKQSRRKEQENERGPKETGENITTDNDALAAIEPATAGANCGRNTANSAAVAETSSGTGG
jgi:hypothetical protein